MAAGTGPPRRFNILIRWDNGISLVRADESLEIARRYYGIYTVMLEIALKMHDDFVSKVDAEYLTRLDTVRHRAASARADAERLSAATNDAALRRILSHNISAQAETLEAAVIYGNRLREQRNRMKETRARIAERHEVAVNTWRTVRLSSELVGMVRAAGQDFDVLMSLDIPDLRPFENRELQEEFGKISRELAPVS